MAETGRGITYPTITDLHPSADWWAAFATTTDAAIGDAEAAAAFTKGAIPEGADMNDVTTPGIYSVASSTVGESLVNGPGLGQGSVIVTRTLNGYVSQQYVTTGHDTTVWLRSVVSVTNESWSTWRDLGVTGNEVTVLAEGADLDTVKSPGLYAAPTTGTSTTLLNTPDQLPAMLEVLEVSPAFWVQRWSSYGNSGSVYSRATRSVTSGAWTEWRDLGPTEAGALDAGPYRHTDLVSRARQRRGGRIGTSGRAAVALRFDHHLDGFESKVLPLLRKYRLPWAQAINPENLGTRDDNATFTELQDWCLDAGGEVWNHGGNHNDATTEGDLFAQIVTSLASLQAGLPALAIEGWAPPGLAVGGYMGTSPFKTTAQNTETLAGQLIIGHHAFVAGYAPGQYRTLDPSVQPIGAPHITVDTATLSQLTSVLNQVQPMGAGVAFMLHPNYLDQEGYISTADLDAFLASIAARRDAGDLVVLSYSGLWLADAASDYRHDLAPTTTSAVGAGEPLTVGLPWYRADQFYGAVRELVVEVTAASPTTLTIVVDGRAATTHTVPAGTSTVRRFVTLPANRTGTAALPVVITPAAALTVAAVHAFAA